jgi:starch-binding outer membrane protein, SusD/RagB family
MKVMKYYNKILLITIVAGTMFGFGCNLNETLQSTLTSAQADSLIVAQGGATTALQAAYNDLAVPFTNQDEVFSLEENTSDECLVPTRGSDWDDNGVWRVLHEHEWTADHAQIQQVFDNLSHIVFDATNALTFKPSNEQAAEARFLRAFAIYYQDILFGQVPFRQPGDNLLNPPKVLSDTAAMGFVISELNAIIPELSASNPVYKATPDAARELLMMAYLNYATLINRETTYPNFTFDPTYMQNIISIGESIINSGKYTFEPDYFDIFAPNNSNMTTETIFSYLNTPGAANNSGVNARWMMTLHYNSFYALAPNAGWNGFSTLSAFYDLFNNDPGDRRVGGTFPGVTNVSGLHVGFLRGIQYDENGNVEFDRKGDTLDFTDSVQNSETDPVAIENAGIRVLKYPPDFGGSNFSQYSSSADNDLILLRYADVVMMTAEAYLRTGDNADALNLVNMIRTARGAAPLASIDLPTLLAERGREFYWESVRRTDLIRFGQYLVPWSGKTVSGDVQNLYFPIPNTDLAVNPNLTQNPGYGN